MQPQTSSMGFVIMRTSATTLTVPVELRVLTLRNQKVILDTHLAKLYAVSVKRLNQQVNRNRRRFPADFIFQITAEEHESLRLQTATSNTRRGGRRYMPYAFTEHGTIMAATVLNSARAVKMSIFVVRAFVRLSEILVNDRQLADKMEELERRLQSHDGTIQEIIGAIKALMLPKQPPRKRIGFQTPAGKAAASPIQSGRLHLLH